MAVYIQGTIKTGGAFEISTKNGQKSMLVSFSVIDELGTSYPCQMWSDDPQQAELIPVIGQARRRQVQCVVSSYSLRMRQFKDGRPEQPQINFVVTDVAIPGLVGSATTK